MSAEVFLELDKKVDQRREKGMMNMLILNCGRQEQYLFPSPLLDAQLGLWNERQMSKRKTHKFT